MQITRVLETCLYVDDLEVAAAFYDHVIGLVPFAKEAGRHVFCRCGQATVLLFAPGETEQSSDVPSHGASGPGHVSFAMSENDIDSWREHLQQHGVEIEREIAWSQGGYSLYFRDPAGNSLELATPQVWGFSEVG